MTLATVLGALLFASAAVWLGGLVTLTVVAVSAQRTLGPDARVRFLRDLGRRYLPVGVTALAVSLGSGLALLLRRPWTPASALALLLGLVLAAALAAGVVQARQMSALRAQAAIHPDDGTLALAVHRGARRALVLRSGLVALTVVLLVVAVVLVGD